MARPYPPNYVAEYDQLSAKSSADLDVWVDLLIELRSVHNGDRIMAAVVLAGVMNSMGVRPGSPIASVFLVAVERLADAKTAGATP